jgi:predicted transposase YbfD/YdcC
MARALGADQDTGGGHRHRRQDAAPLLSEEGAERADPHGFGLRRAPRLVLGQVAVAEKSNEIVAIPALLGMMAIEGAVVTIDAMDCQRNIAKKIIARKADYSSRSKVIRERFARMSTCSQTSRKPMASRIRQSAGTRRSTAITAASKPEPIPRSTMSAGCKSGTIGRD